MKLQPDPLQPFHLFVTGGAGTGKSHVIKAMHENLKQSVSGGPDTHAHMLMTSTQVLLLSTLEASIHRAL